MSRSVLLTVGFGLVSLAILALAGLLVVRGIVYSPQLIVATCGQILDNLLNHLYFDPLGVVSMLILIVTIVGLGLGLIRVMSFLLSIKKLTAGLSNIDYRSAKLDWAIRRHNLDNIKFVVTEDADLTAYTLGLINPRIVVSAFLVRHLSRHQLEAVILHELYHVRSRHVLWLFLLRVVSSVLFFVPLIDYLAKQIKFEFELAADAFAMSTQQTRRHVCSSLALNLNSSTSMVPNFAGLAIERRVESLVAGKTRWDQVNKTYLGISLLMVSLMLGAVIWFQPAYASGEARQPVEEVSCRQVDECVDMDCVRHAKMWSGGLIGVE